MSSRNPVPKDAPSTPPAVERMFDATLGTHIPAGDLAHTWRGQPGPPAERGLA